MNNFKNKGRSGGNDRRYEGKDRNTRDSFSSNRRDFRDRDSDRPTMFSAVCDNCGKRCQVPFKPSGDKPVYCSECFEEMGHSSHKSNSSGSNDNYNIQNQLKDINMKLDKILSQLKEE